MMAPTPNKASAACCLPVEIEDELEPLGGLAFLAASLPSSRELDDLIQGLRLLADPIRLKVLLTLERGQQCVCVLKELTGISDPRLSYHLGQLRKEGLVSSRRDRSYNRYTLTTRGEELLAALHAFESERSPR